MSAARRDALLAAIAADLDNDAPRHVYADWLESTGDLAGARRIRTQLALALDPGDVELRRAAYEALPPEADDRCPGAAGR